MSLVSKFTVKKAEITVAVILALSSLALMIKSMENRITWNAEENMGAGFLPFYLSLGMLICCVLVIINFFLKRTPQSKDETPFIDPEAFKFVSVTLISLSSVGFCDWVSRYLFFFNFLFGFLFTILQR
jgi:putative tricarboxylic transport membrane protein